MNLDERKYVLIGGVLFICVVFVLRLFWIQVVDQHWAARAADISERKITVFPSRGLIIDRHGELLVANTPVYDIMVVPREVKGLDTLGLSQLLNVPMDQVRERLRKAAEYSVWKPSEFEKQITAGQYAAISVQLYKYPGFYAQSRTLRTYPPHVGAHMLGYISEVNARQVERDPYYKPGDMIGVGGLESFYEKELRGKRGVKYVVVDVHNNIQGSFNGGEFDTLAHAGKNLYTSIDLQLQSLGERLMQHKKGSIVALDPRTGEVLALVSSPSYDPELLTGRVRNSNYRSLQQDSLRPLFDRALQAQYPPGSIFKLAQAAIALQEGVINLNTGFPCNKALVGCHNHPYAANVEQAVQFSCNPYFYQVFKREVEQGAAKNRFEDAALGLAKWKTAMESFGLGHPPRLDLPAVKGGSIPGVNFYNRIYGEKAWSFSTIYSLSIGQGEVLVAPVQMANLAAIFANRGYYYDPHLVRAIGSPDSLNTHVQRHHTMVDDQWFPPLVEGMRRVVNEPGGTARQARIPGITVCGKTGTAQNPHGKDHAVFIAFAPMDDPKIAIAVYVENSGFGGTWAAPIASLCMEQYLTDTITRPDLMQRMLEADLIATEGNYTKFVSKRRKQ
ncbi:MAG TPA: penicillin-binding protein 2 [Flavobacteriales bacterium]|nr:penicillin-binding protein 2 [Flavobacteriales bacterium]HRP81869.1 penicillin-binding protein 2 [Flavobacteriales bacterium]